MKNVIAGIATALLVWSTVPQAQTPTPATEEGLSDLAAMTFGCPKAALNAAAREATQVRSQGTYQFSYFRIINDSHHATYQVHFRSNYRGEKDLKYCVAVYCQQGWDPKTTKTTVMLMNDSRKAPNAPTHGGSCQ
jgi:hypothetical protein